MEVFLEDRVIVVDERALRKAQAAWRGAIVRIRMRALKKVYEDIFYDIEDSSAKDPWRSAYLSKIWSESSVLWKPFQSTVRKKQFPIHDDAAATEITHVNSEETEGTEEEKHETNGNASVAADTLGDSNQVTLVAEGENNLKDAEHPTETSCDQNFVSTCEVRASDGKMLDVLEDDPTKLGSETSVWESVDACNKEQSALDKEEQRKQIIMELLWIQQAINSRKQYLELKKQMP